MEKIDSQVVSKLMRAARLKGDDMDVVIEQLDPIFSLAAHLEEVQDTDDALLEDDLTLSLRSDCVADEACQEDILLNAPHRAFNMFLVPKILG